MIHPADVQDRDGAIPLLRAAQRLFPFVEVIFADGAYRGDATAAAVAGTGRWRLEIVSRGDAKGFVPLAKRYRGADLRLARALPAARQRLREPRRQRARLPLPRHGPPHAAKARKNLSRLANLPDGL